VTDSLSRAPTGSGTDLQCLCVLRCARSPRRPPPAAPHPRTRHAVTCLHLHDLLPQWEAEDAISSISVNDSAHTQHQLTKLSLINVLVRDNWTFHTLLQLQQLCKAARCSAELWHRCLSRPETTARGTQAHHTLHANSCSYFPMVCQNCFEI